MSYAASRELASLAVARSANEPVEMSPACSRFSEKLVYAIVKSHNRIIARDYAIMRPRLLGRKGKEKTPEISIFVTILRKICSLTLENPVQKLDMIYDNDTTLLGRK